MRVDKQEYRVYTATQVTICGVAQLVEQVTVNHWVGGSSPSTTATAVRGADSASMGTKVVDGFYQEAVIEEQAHKLSPALRASESLGTKVVDGFYQ